MADLLGDKPIEDQHYKTMNNVAHALDVAFNGDEKPGTTGFILMVFPLNDHEGRCNYISNARREDVVVMLKEQLARLEGQPEVKGHA